MMDSPYNLTKQEYYDESQYDTCLEKVTQYMEELKDYIEENGIDLDDPFFEEYNLSKLDLLAAKHHFRPTDDSKQNFINELWDL